MDLRTRNGLVDVSTVQLGSVFEVTVHHLPSGKWLKMEGDEGDEEWLIGAASQALMTLVSRESLARLGW